MNTNTITKVNIQEELIDFLCEQFLVDIEDIEIDKSLVDTGIIDSIGLIEISDYITKKYSITISNDQMTKANFGSVEKIVNFIFENNK